MLFRIFYFSWRCTAISAKELQINDEIKAKEVRLIGPEGEQLGIVSIDEARNVAYSKDLDLVLIAPGAEPPVCRAMDYGKYRFECDKREREARKKQQVVELKEIQLSCNIDTHDFETKLRHAHRFLGDGNKVKVVIKFKGREMAHMGIGKEVLERFEAGCEGKGAALKKPQLDGRYMSIVLAPPNVKQ